MNTTNLPPLPIAAVDEHNLQGGRLLYSRDQMQAYARAAIQRFEHRPRHAQVLPDVRCKVARAWDAGTGRLATD